LRKKPTPEFLKAIERSLRPSVKRLERWARGDKSSSVSLGKSTLSHKQSGLSHMNALIQGPSDLELVAPPGPAPIAPAEADITIRSEDRVLLAFRREDALNFVWPTLSGFARLQNQAPTDLFPTDPSRLSEPDAKGRIGGALRTDGPTLMDISFSDQSTLQLMLDTHGTPFEPHGIRFFQSVTSPIKDTPALQVVGESGLRSGGTFSVEARLLNPLLPVLVTLLDADGYSVSTGIIAFPSLARGALHYGEARTLAPCPDPAQAFLSYDHARFQERLQRQPAVCALVVDPENGLKSEPIFSDNMEEWLGAVFGHTLHFKTAGDETGATLFLPYDAIPTIAALTAASLPVAAHGSYVLPAYVVCNRDDNSPYSVVSWPQDQANLQKLQPKDSTRPPVLQHGPQQDDMPTSAGPNVLSLRFCDLAKTHHASLVFPHAPDNPAPIFPSLSPTSDVLCQIKVSNLASVQELLETLSRQTWASRMRLLIAPTREGMAAQLESDLSAFPGTWEILPPQADVFQGQHPDDLACLKGLSDDTCIMNLSEQTLLHDVRVVETLCALISSDGVAMSGCVSLTELPSRRGFVLSVENSGYFPTQVSLVGAPTFVFSELDTITALPNATYPVVAPPEEAFAVHLGALRKAHTAMPLLRCPGQPALAIGLALTALEQRCMCTSAVSTLRVGPPAYREAMDPVTLADWPVSEWQDILSRVTLVQKVA
jgi:hypothetical protein